MAIQYAQSDSERAIAARRGRLAVAVSANVNNTRPNVNIALPPLTSGKVKMVGVRMTEDEIETIDAARGKVSRQDFLRKAALWLADQADRLK